MIYFDENEQAYNTPIDNYIATCEDTRWLFYSQPENRDKYKLDRTTKQPVDITDTEEYKAKKEAERQEEIGNISMTRGDVFEALILARGITKTQIRAMIENAELDDITKALYLNRFDEALEFYRKFPLFDLLGQSLGVTAEQLDNFFITKNYEFLKVAETPEETEGETSGDTADEGEGE